MCRVWYVFRVLYSILNCWCMFCMCVILLLLFHLAVSQFFYIVLAFSSKNGGNFHRWRKINSMRIESVRTTWKLRASLARSIHIYSIRQYENFTGENSNERASDNSCNADGNWNNDETTCSFSLCIIFSHNSFVSICKWASMLPLSLSLSSHLSFPSLNQLYRVTFSFSAMPQSHNPPSFTNSVSRN